MATAPILHVDAERGFSGGEVQVFHLLRGLRARGWTNVLVAPPRSAAAERAAAEGFEVEPCSMRSNLDLAAVLRLRRIFSRCAGGSNLGVPEGRALVHLHTGRATALGSKAAAGLGLPVVTTRRMDRRVRRGPATRLLYGRLVDAAVAISGPVREQLLAAGVAPERVQVIHSSVDPDDVRAADPERARAELRRALDLGADQLLLLVMARLDARKGVDVLLRALAQAPDAGRAWHLAVAGDGPEAANLADLAAELGLAGRTRFLGRRADKAELLAAADALALPSYKEGLGVAALEAMAAGRAVLASRVGGLAEAVVEDRTGLFNEPGDVDGLARNLERLAGDRMLLAALGAAGPERIAEAYHVDRMVAAYEALYRRLLTAS